MWKRSEISDFHKIKTTGQNLILSWCTSGAGGWAGTSGTWALSKHFRSLRSILELLELPAAGVENAARPGGWVCVCGGTLLFLLPLFGGQRSRRCSCEHTAAVILQVGLSPDWSYCLPSPPTSGEFPVVQEGPLGFSVWSRSLVCCQKLFI